MREAPSLHSSVSKQATKSLMEYNIKKNTVRKLILLRDGERKEERRKGSHQYHYLMMRARDTGLGSK